MKNKIYLFAVLLLIFNCKNQTNKQKKIDTNTIKTETDYNSGNAHNSKKSLDYYGTYKGIIPCADCEGIKTSLILNKENSYIRAIQYLGKEVKTASDKGLFTWNKNVSIITITSSSGGTQMYKVGENMLLHLDKEGNIIQGDLSKNYKLTKN